MLRKKALVLGFITVATVCIKPALCESAAGPDAKKASVQQTSTTLSIDNAGSKLVEEDSVTSLSKTRDGNLVLRESGGSTAVVDLNGQTVTYHSALGDRLWVVNVQESLKLDKDQKIRHIRSRNGKLLVVIGKHTSASIDPATGRVEMIGSD